MHLKRQQSTTKLPIPRKGTKYVARALSSPQNSVPLVIAVRDMLKLAKTSKDVKKMMNQKLLKINGRLPKDIRESIFLFNSLEADKPYILTILPTKKFSFQHAKKSDSRLCKIIGKKLVKKNKIQLNCHDGTNLLSKDKILVGDSIHLDFSGKIKEHISLEKGRNVFIISGKYTGFHGRIKSREGNKVEIQIESHGTTILNQNQLIAL